MNLKEWHQSLCLFKILNLQKAKPPPAIWAWTIWSILASIQQQKSPENQWGNPVVFSKENVFWVFLYFPVVVVVDGGCCGGGCDDRSFRSRKHSKDFCLIFLQPIMENIALVSREQRASEQVRERENCFMKSMDGFVCSNKQSNLEAASQFHLDLQLHQLLHQLLQLQLPGAPSMYHRHWIVDDAAMCGYLSTVNPPACWLSSSCVCVFFPSCILSFSLVTSTSSCLWLLFDSCRLLVHPNRKIQYK